MHGLPCADGEVYGVRRGGFGLGKTGPARWLLRVTTLITIVLLPGTLQLSAYPAAAVASRVVLKAAELRRSTRGRRCLAPFGSEIECVRCM